MTTYAKTFTAALTIALVLVSALVLAFATRWEVSNGQAGVFRLDRWTGSVTQCAKFVTTHCE
jgi:hypothetical protein